MDYNVFMSGPRKGQPKLLRDRIIRFLVEGMRLTVVSNSPKSSKFRMNFKDEFIFVGQNGSVRSGKNKVTSHDISHNLRIEMEKWES